MCSLLRALRCTWPTHLGVKAFIYRRVKNEKDAADLADLLRMGQAR